LLPTIEQKQVFQKWRHTARYVYNKTLFELKNNHSSKNKFKLRNNLITKQSYKCPNCTSLSKSLLCKQCDTPCDVKINDTIYDWESKTPKEIRFSSMKSVLIAYKSALTNLKRGNILGFNVSYKKKNKTARKDCIDIDKNSIQLENKQIRMYPSRIKEPIKIGKRSLKMLTNFTLYDHCKLHFDGKNYNLIVCKQISDKDIKPKEQRSKIIACDPGSATFITGYDPDGKVIEIDRNHKLMDKFRKKLELLTKLRKRKSCLQKIRDKRSNYITEMHWQAINQLTSEYNIIILPHFKSQEIVKKSNKKALNKNLMILSHYKFLQRLIYKAQTMENTHVIYKVKENHTTQTCGRCGSLKRLGLNERTYQCEKCDLCIGRDVNGSRNILLKTLVEYNTK
jgi:putative transposase